MQHGAVSKFITLAAQAFFLSLTEPVIRIEPQTNKFANYSG